MERVSMINKLVAVFAITILLSLNHIYANTVCINDICTNNPCNSTKTISHSFALNGSEKLVVSTANGYINLQKHDKNQIDITVIYKAVDDEELEKLVGLTDIKINNSLCAIAQKMPSSTVFSWGFTTSSVSSSCAAVSFDISAPSWMTVNDLQTSNGSISSRDIDQVLKAKTSNGNIDVNNILSKINALSSNGRISIKAADGNENNIYAKTSNGRIEFENIQGNAAAKTSNGTININTVKNYQGDLSYKTSNGNIYVNGKKMKKNKDNW